MIYAMPNVVLSSSSITLTSGVAQLSTNVNMINDHSQCDLRQADYTNNMRQQTAKGEIKMNRQQYNEMLNTAKELGIKGYGQMKKDILIAAIEAASEASRNNSGDDGNTDNLNAGQQQDDGFFVDDRYGDNSEEQHYDPRRDIMVHTPVIHKRIEYVMADNTQVCFLADGFKVRIYWDTNNYKLTIHSQRRGRSPITYAKLIRMFQPLNNGVDGDVAQVVKAIVRIKDMPSVIKHHRHQKLVEAGKVPANRTKENTTTTKRTGTVDPQWMQRFIEFFEDTIGRRPTGVEIQTEWKLELETRGA